MGNGVFGTAEGIRTPDLLVRSQTLYPAELQPQVAPSIDSSGIIPQRKLKCKRFFEISPKIFEEILGIENVLKNEPMSRHTTFKTGGNADVFCEPESILELQELLKLLKANNQKPTVIGNGSNLLVKDNGIRGVVIKIGEKMSNAKADGKRVEVEYVDTFGYDHILKAKEDGRGRRRSLK